MSAEATARSVPLVFVVGTGRCGTHSLWKLFESVPNTLSMHEGTGIVRSGPAAQSGKRVGLGCMPELNSYLYHYANEADFERTFAPDAAMTSLLDGCFAGRASAIAWCATHGIAYCDANPFAFNFINYLHARYPNAKFIHLVRDGYACVQSWFRRDASTYPDEVPSVPSAIGWLLAKPMPFPSDPVYEKWASFDRVQKISWFWSSVNANIARRLARVPAGNRLAVRIEDVNTTSANAILAFCGLPRQFVPEALAPEDPSQYDDRELEWTPENRRKFNALAAPVMEKLGYAVR